MLEAIFGYKIKFSFFMPNGTVNGGYCDHPDSILKVFEMVRDLRGCGLIIMDETIYKDRTDFNDEISEEHSHEP